jgi:hypothetical protein
MAFFESRVFILTIRVIQALLTILILGLTGYGKPLIATNLAEDVANNIHSLPLVDHLLACRCTLIGQLPAVLRGNHADHSHLLDRGTDAFRGKQAQPRRRDHWSRRLDYDFLVRRLRGSCSLLEPPGLLWCRLQCG